MRLEDLSKICGFSGYLVRTAIPAIQGRHLPRHERDICELQLLRNAVATTNVDQLRCNNRFGAVAV